MDTEPAPHAPAPSSPRPHYPRPWWISVPRLILAFFCIAGLLPIVLVGMALLKHTLFTEDRDLLDPGQLLWELPLTAVSIWAFVDMMKEDLFRSQQRRAKWNQPPEQDWQEKLVAARAKGDRQAEVNALSSIGFFLQVGRHYEEATPYLKEALSLARAIGDHPFEEERALSGLGHGAFARGDLDTAENLYRERLAVVTTLDVNHRDEIADAYASVGEFLCEYRGKREEGCQMLAQAQAIYHEIGQSERRWLKRRWLTFEQRMRDLRREYGDESV